MKIAVVILAGGKGTRIGGEKPLILLRGVTLLDRTLGYACGLSDVIAVAVRDIGQIGDANVTVLRDDPAIDGPLAGLVAALCFARDESADAVLTIPTDMPFLPSNLVDRLGKKLPKEGAAIASSGGHLHPVCGLWLTKILDFVPDYVASGRRSLKGLAETVGCVVVDWPSEPIDPFFNINNPEDLITAAQMLRD